MSIRVGIIVIGNEILSGKVHDENSHFFARELRSLGAEVERISVIGDTLDEIAREVLDFSRRFDVVLTTGGVGPTHDDVTIAGIAKGFGVRVVRHPALEAVIYRVYQNDVNEAKLKMAEIPEGAELIASENLSFPIVFFKNVYIFPGVPEILRHKFEIIKERFRDAPFYLHRVFVSAGEGSIAETLNEVTRAFPSLALGSYPVFNRLDYKVMITLESRKKELLEDALKFFLERLPEKYVVKID
ncbi:MAG: competence/damage-inducible protein A [Vicinamibacteria bacterium]